MVDPNNEALEELEILLYYEYLDTIRSNFWKFCLYWDKAFFTERSYLKDIADAFQLITDGEIKNLSVSMPPRAGKSYITSLYSLWTLGNNPTGSIMRNSCTTTLATKFSYDVRGFISDPRFIEVFDDIKLSKDKAAVTGWNLEQSEQVGYFCGGVGSTIIGFGCNLLSILDDPIKDVEEAFSENVLEKKWDWFNGAMRSRKEKSCPEIHIATRWSKRDIIGRLSEANQFDIMIKVPALNKDGNSFCESVTSKEELLTQKLLLPQAVWEAEYMQEPIEAKGLLYPKDKLNYFDEIELDTPIVCTVDVADTGEDYLCAVFGQQDSIRVYIKDIIFTQEPVEVTEPMLASRLIEHNVSICRIESNNAGRIFARNISKILKDLGSTTVIQPRATKTNKETRMYLRSGYIVNNFYFRENPEGDYAAYFNQLINTYKNVAKNKHDDAADSTTMLAEFIENTTKHNW